MIKETAMRLMLGFALCLMASAATAQEVPLSGSFTASKACPAYLSFRKHSNPGDVSVEAGKTYPVLSQNNQTASHYRITVAGAQPEQRWVAVECGSHDGAAAADQKPGDAKPEAKAGGDSYILAISWEPAFCEGLPHKPECQSQTAERFDASHFSLHGLWPQPRGREYCGVAAVDKTSDENHRWDALPEVRLSADVKASLDQVMPGTQSQLERHEWIKHGTCYPADSADVYFRDAVKLMSEINASPVQAYFAGMTGKTVRLSDVRAKFDEAFGAGTGERIRIACKDDGNRRLITEITIGLKGEIGPETKLSTLMMASGSTKGGCNQGEIDPAGLQ